MVGTTEISADIACLNRLIRRVKDKGVLQIETEHSARELAILEMTVAYLESVLTRNPNGALST